MAARSLCTVSITWKRLMVLEAVEPGISSSLPFSVQLRPCFQRSYYLPLYQFAQFSHFGE